MGPLVVSRPAPDAAEYYVEVRPEFDHVAYARVIAKRVGGKVGYIYHNFHAFTIHAIPESAVEKIRKMPEVLKVVKSQMGTLD
ncbi:MAG: protease inhibitor I9 family protein [Gemmatimonadota bacterium]|nr:protease inhibitor I9 family protein [Gemmatimonadota bacterium]